MNALKASLVKALLRCCALLPLSLARALGRGTARLYWHAGGRARRITERNVQLAFPWMAPEKQRSLAMRSLCATGELAAEAGRVWLRDWSRVSRLIREVSGEELIHRARAEGRGVVVLAPHLGNWEVLGLHLPSLGPTVSLYEPPRLSALGPIMQRARERSGATLVPTDRRGVAQLLRALRGGAIAGILPDQVPSDLRAGENAPFMGVSCFTATLAHGLIRRSGALAVFGFAQRVPGGFALRFSAADPAVGGEDTGAALTALNLGIERCLQQCVEQYQWEYKRFRERPHRGPGRYDDI
jgi:KDO2-lipid IV(A) lauroyltransferase